MCTVDTITPLSKIIHIQMPQKTDIHEKSFKTKIEMFVVPAHTWPENLFETLRLFWICSPRNSKSSSTTVGMSAEIMKKTIE